ncbi:MAG: tetratricopeptide repeat protein [Bacteroidales bacterium]|nr:tetratricopeptide repeat protein [Bacteroidales bacterium]
MRIFQQLLFLFAFCIPTLLVGQTSEWRLMRQGNRAFRLQDYKTAENLYRQAQTIAPNSARAAFNLGDAYLAQKNNKAALEQYERAVKNERNRTIRAMAQHNVGYVHHVAKDYDKAIEAYKAALRLNPNDEGARYNLVLAQKQRKQQQDQKQQRKQQQKEQQKQQDSSQQEQQQQNSPQNQQSQMSQDNVEQLLQLSRQAEQQTRQKVQQAAQPRPRQLDKNW